jgi:phage gp46-like protein
MAGFPYDLSLVFDAARLGCDLAFADGDLVLSSTPATAMLVSIFSDRRAASDDDLPAGVSDLGAPASWDERRGWIGDALDRAGRRVGSRLWLLSRAHDDEETRALAESYVDEALSWSADEYGVAPEIAVSWARSGVLAIRASIDGTAVSLVRKVT